MTAFLGGYAQFFIPTHLLAVAAIGLMAGQVRFPVITLGAFAFGLLVGSFMVASAIEESPAPIVLLALAAIAGGLVLIGHTILVFFVSCLASVTGVFIPANSPPHEITIAAAVLSQIGLAVAALTTFAAVMLIAAVATRPWQRIGVRIAGSWIAASALLVLALRLAR